MRSRKSIFLACVGVYFAICSALGVDQPPKPSRINDSLKIDSVQPLTAAPKPAVSAVAKPAVSTAAKPIRRDSTASGEPQGALVDYQADLMVERGDEIMRLIGNVIFHHNGAIIQCDSAFKYDVNRMDFFGKVLIYQDSTYIYGDRVNYDGRTAVADVFAPIVKTTRGDMTLLTYNLNFNTKTSIGTYHGGGVLRSKDNLIESQRGVYNSDRNEVRFLDSVAMRSDSYIIRTDSVSYNLDAEQATFLDTTYIWDHDRDFMVASWGDYYSKSETYVFTRRAYIMTPDNELWADTVRYVTPVKQAFMQTNVQILDTANSTLAFGDWGFYDDSLGRAVLTETPSVRVWQEPDSLSGKVDTSYMRADTIRMLTFEKGQSKLVAADSVGGESADELMETSQDFTDSLHNAADSMIVGDSLRVNDSLAVGDSLIVNDSLVVNDSLILKDSLPPPPVVVDSLPPVTDSVPMVADSLPISDSLIVGDSLSVNDSLTVNDSLSIAKNMQVADTTKKEDDRERVMRAYHHVRMWAEDYQAVCDSSVSFSVDSTAVMYGKPVLWSDNNQITSNQIDIYSKNEAMDWADFTGEPFITQQAAPGDTLLFNQASGKRLRVYFKDNEIDYAWLTGNVMNLYYMEDNAEIVAMASITCAELTIFFEGREPIRMHWAGAGEGPIHPIEKIPADQPRFLEGFTWQEDIRPKNAAEICSRVALPSFRSQAEQFYQPSFSIEKQMSDNKTGYIATGLWSDRTDLISVAPDYFEQRNRNLLF